MVILIVCLIGIWLGIMYGVHAYVMQGALKHHVATYIPTRRIKLFQVRVLEAILSAFPGVITALILIMCYNYVSSVLLAVVIAIIWINEVELVSRWGRRMRATLVLPSIRNSYDNLLSTEQLLEQEALIEYYEQVNQGWYAVKYTVVPVITEASLDDILYILFMCGITNRRNSDFREEFLPLTEQACITILHTWAQRNGANIKIAKFRKHFIASMEYEGESYVLSWIKLPRFYKVTDIESAVKSAAKGHVDKSVTHFYTPDEWVSVDSVKKGMYYDGH